MLMRTSQLQDTEDMKRNAMLLALASAIVVPAAPAEWRGKGEAGIVLARGNTETDAINLKLASNTEIDRWKHSLDMAALRAVTSGITTAERYDAGWQSDHRLSERSFWFGALRYQNDAFSGFDYQASAAIGFGYKFINTDKVKFAGQAGAGYRRLQNAVTGEASEDSIATGGFDYENKLTDTTKVIDKFRVESGSDNTLFANYLGIEVRMITVLSLAVGLDVRSNTNPPAGLKKTDTLTTANVVYSF